MTKQFVPPNFADPRLNVRRRYQMMVGGRSVDAGSGETIRRVSPGHADVVVGEWPSAGPADAAKAITAARRAFDDGPWPRMSGGERSAILHRVAEGILKAVEEIALIESLEVGKPLAQARGEITFSAELWSYAAGMCRSLEGQTFNSLGENVLGLVLREPVGVVGTITPWNFPFIIASERIPWAIGAGCTVVVKPSELTSGSTIRMAEIARDAGLPDGVLNVITGYGDKAGQILAEDQRTDMLAFTGSLRVGSMLGGLAVSNIKRTGLELGGKGPQIVFDDADLEAAIQGVVYGIFHNAGQCCISGSRLIVQRGIRDELVKGILDVARSVPFGDPLQDGTKFGPMISDGHASKVVGYIEKGVADGADVLMGGSSAQQAGGHYIAPTIFAGVSEGMAISREEIFGPVLSILDFSSPEEAVSLANASEFGLSASVWSSNFSNALQTIRKVRAGRCWINGVIDGAPEMPIGGYKKSGIGRELGRYGFDEYSEF